MANIEWWCESCGKRNATNHNRSKCFSCGHARGASTAGNVHKSNSDFDWGIVGGAIFVVSVVSVTLLALSVSPTFFGIPVVAIVVWGVLSLLRRLGRR